MQISDYLSQRGKVVELSKKLGLSHSIVSRWGTGARKVRAEYVLTVERATEGVVTRHDLRPDLYPDKPKRRAA